MAPAYNSAMVDSPGQLVAASPLLETKLYIPRWRPGLVSRPRLIERLDQGVERKLTLVSAPAGFGKSTMLAEWVAATPPRERPAAWVSLDQGDNDPAFFLGLLHRRTADRAARGWRKRPLFAAFASATAN